MSDYIEQLEKQNQLLQEKLADAQQVITINKLRHLHTYYFAIEYHFNGIPTEHKLVLECNVKGIYKNPDEICCNSLKRRLKIAISHASEKSKDKYKITIYKNNRRLFVIDKRNFDAGKDDPISHNYLCYYTYPKYQGDPKTTHNVTRNVFCENIIKCYNDFIKKRFGYDLSE
jgi:hypothetical protein